jgi:hypothetical protein
MKYSFLFVIGSALSLSAIAQTGPQEMAVVVPTNPIAVFAVDETSRTVEAINYEHRGGATDVDLAGTT